MYAFEYFYERIYERYGGCVSLGGINFWKHNIDFGCKVKDFSLKNKENLHFFHHFSVSSSKYLSNCAFKSPVFSIIARISLRFFSFSEPGIQSFM